jgi:signal transduction histidine kinase
MARSSWPSTAAASARPPGDGHDPPPTRGPSASNGPAPADSRAAASAELTRYLTDAHDRIAQGINDVVIRRMLAAGLDLQAALELIGEHRAASQIWHAIGELDQAVRDIREAIFDCSRATESG